MTLMTYRPMQSEPIDPRLGRFIPDDFEHISKHPFKTSVVAATSVDVNRTLRLPHWHRRHDQGMEGSCVGHAVAMERAITNTAQNVLLNIIGWKTRRYDPISIWDGAKGIDEWAETNPGDDNGTSVNAAYRWIHQNGISRVRSMQMSIEGKPVPVGKYPASHEDSVSSFQWATSVDQMRLAIHNGIPITIGVNWYRNFSSPKLVGKEYWIGVGDFGPIDGGHAVCIYGASDRRQAFRVKNNWLDYPLIWLPYPAMARLLNEYGEAALVVDR